MAKGKQSTKTSTPKTPTKKEGGSSLGTIITVLLLLGLGFLAFQNSDAITSAIGSMSSSDEGVLQLTDAAFQQTIDSNDYVLVAFTAPWCGHCKSLAPHFSQAAQHFSENFNNVVLAKVDATQERQFAEKFEVKGYPTIKFFNKGQLQEYNGGRTARDIINWVSRKAGQASVLVQSQEQLSKLQEDNKVLVVLFNNAAEGAVWDAYLETAMAQDKVSFAHVLDSEIAQQNGASNGSVVLFKNFDERRNNFEGELNVENLSTFIANNRIPTVLPFDDEAIELVFQSKLATLMLFQNESEASTNARQVLEDVAKELKLGNFVFAVSASNDGFGHYSRLAEFVGVDTNNAPAFSIIDTRQGAIEKYHFKDQEINRSNIKAYVQNFVQGGLQPTLKSEEIPATNDQPVKVVVGKNFEDIVINNNRDVLLKIYAPWCGHCKSLAPHWDEAAQMLEVNPNIVMAKIDYTANEVAGLKVEGYPTLKFFPGNDKGSVVDYNGGRTTEGIISWLKDNTTHPWVELGKSDL